MVERGIFIKFSSKKIEFGNNAKISFDQLKTAEEIIKKLKFMIFLGKNLVMQVRFYYNPIEGILKVRGMMKQQTFFERLTLFVP